VGTRRRGPAVSPPSKAPRTARRALTSDGWTRTWRRRRASPRGSRDRAPRPRPDPRKTPADEEASDQLRVGQRVGEHPPGLVRSEYRAAPEVRPARIEHPLGPLPPPQLVRPQVEARERGLCTSAAEEQQRLARDRKSVPGHPAGVDGGGHLALRRRKLPPRRDRRPPFARASHLARI
jgi:hypothetical protein